MLGQTFTGDGLSGNVFDVGGSMSLATGYYDGYGGNGVSLAEQADVANGSYDYGGVRGGIGAHIGYSPYCVPNVINGVKCVIVNEALRDVEPMAWDFVMNFARDNGLQVAEACLLPDEPTEK